MYSSLYKVVYSNVRNEISDVRMIFKKKINKEFQIVNRKINSKFEIWEVLKEGGGVGSFYVG